MRFEIHRQADGPQFYWKLVSPNGETLAHSELYHNKGDIREIITRIISAIANGAAYVRDMTDESH